MKIRVKLALLAVSLCALAIAACCTVLIISANGNSVNTAIDGALSEQHCLCSPFKAPSATHMRTAYRIPRSKALANICSASIPPGH